MKKLLLFLSLLAGMTLQAQNVLHIYTRDGGHATYQLEDVDSITFVSTVPGTREAPYTVAQLLEACNGLEADQFLADGKEVYARGIVTKIKEMSIQYGNATYYIADKPQGTPQFYVFRGFMLDRSRVTTGDELAVGDTVVVCGKVKNYQGRTLEFDTGNYIVEQNAVQSAAKEQGVMARLEFPLPRNDANNLVVVHKARLNSTTDEEVVNYSIEWDNTVHAQRWSCYQLYASLLAKNASRYQGGYLHDTWLPQSWQFSNDPYWNTGYDHGHICPSADRLSSEEMNEQTFYLTNMQPQVHSFNAGIWEKMESQVRGWANRYDTLYVCKGGTIDSEANIVAYLGSGSNKIPVPRYFFMALLGKSKNGYSAIGLWVEHRDDIPSTNAIGQYAVNIRELEQLTGIDFFHNLPDIIEEQVETLPQETIKNAWGL